MRNEYDAPMDANGYAPSIIDMAARCHICGYEGTTVRHEVFHGAYRQKSKALGLWVHLCPDCHMKLHGTDVKLDYNLKHEGQQVAMDTYEWSIKDFISRFGRNYWRV